MAEEEAQVEIAIVGGGLGGLALALGLQERGITAHVFEKSDGVRADTATAVSMGLNAVRALDGIRPGLAEALKASGSETKTMSYVDHTDGQEPSEQLMTKSPVLFMIPWRRARQVLCDLLSSSSFHPLHTLVSYSANEEEGVDLLFDVKSSSSTEHPGFRKRVRAKLVIGADGTRSAVRKIMVGDRPRDLHLINWNALVYNPESRLFHVHEKDQIVMIRNGSVFAHLVDAGEGYTMIVLRMNNDDLRGRGFATPEIKERLLDEISSLQPFSIWEPLKRAVEATEPGQIFERRIIDNPVLTKWSDLDGRVLLIADAAHAMHWGPGQGARVAFEDAHQLSLLLSEASEMRSAVFRFEELRVPRMARIQAYAAESTGLAEFTPDWVQQLPVSERMKRSFEFQAWVDSYPEKMSGDPESMYWK